MTCGPQSHLFCCKCQDDILFVAGYYPPLRAYHVFSTQSSVALLHVPLDLLGSHIKYIDSFSSSNLAFYFFGLIPLARASSALWDRSTENDGHPVWFLILGGNSVFCCGVWYELCGSVSVAGCSFLRMLIGNVCLMHLTIISATHQDHFFLFSDRVNYIDPWWIIFSVLNCVIPT